MKKFITASLTIFVSIASCEQKVSQQMNALVEAYANNGRFNGTVLVTQRGNKIYEAAFGYRDAENKVLHKTGDVFQIGSITKQITAAIIMQLQEEGKLSVHDKLSKYFNGFTYGDSITIKNLLTHTSGIFNYTNDTIIMKNDVTRHYSQQQMLDIFKGYKPDFAPGTKWNYSNSAYSILGYIIEKTTKKPFEKVVRERIFIPLQMANSGFDFTHLAAPNKSKGYFSLAEANPWAAPVVDSTIAYSAGAIYSTVEDLAKWERAVTEGKILKQQSWQEIFTPFKNKYGYGWAIDTLYGRSFTGHSGGIHGFASYIIRFPKDELAVIMLDNASSRDLAKISKALAAVAFQQAYEIPAVRKTIAVDSVILQKYVGEYELTPEFIITVSRHGSALKAQATNQSRFDIYAEKEDVFFFKVVDAKLQFIKDETGKVTGLVLDQSGVQQKAKKIK